MELGKVKVFFTIMLMVCLTDLITAKIFNKCELAEALRAQNVPESDVPMYVCIATHESSLNSRAVNMANGDESWDHGLWQISDKYWVGRYAPGGACDMSAEDVTEDDIGPAVKCIRIILDEHQRLQGDGWLAWTVYSGQGHCRNDLSSYVSGC